MAAKSRCLRQTKGRSSRRKHLAQRQIPGAGPRLDHGRPLPVLAQALVVGESGLERDRQRCCARIRPKAQIGSEDVAVLGAVLQQAHQFLGDPDITLLRTAVVPVVDLVAVEEHDEINVR